MAQGPEAKERIIRAAMELINTEKDIDRITIRNIAERAGVGTGLINYHFQTKENLLKQCVQLIIGDVITGFEPLYKSLELAPADKLKYLLKATCLFLTENPAISRISILSDLTSGQGDDNSVQSTDVYWPVFLEVFGKTKTEKEIKVIAQMFISTIQLTFLRADIYKKQSGIDFFNREQRGEFIDMLVDAVVGEK